MPIHPLPQFEADLAEDRKVYETLKPPTSIVVRFGIMKLVGEYPYSGDAKPGCGSKLVVRTHRGIELAEMLTTTCGNAGCSKSVTRQEMLEYIENSGGRDYPFFNQGRVMRVATMDDLNQQAKIDAERPKHVMRAREIHASIEPLIPMKIVDAEPILGGEKITFYFTSEDRVDFRDLVSRLAAEYHTRIEMRQVGARDEARLVADYERCGQHCCCKQFLKVLKPISMKSAKIQKATLDPLKISGRCGRLMCCLRYEDESYDDLRKRLPKKKVRLRTAEGWGLVMDTQILTQLVLLRLEHVEKDVAVTVEDLGLVDGKQPPEFIEALEASHPIVVGPPPPPAASPSGPGGPPRGGDRGPRSGPRPNADGSRQSPPSGRGGPPMPANAPAAAGDGPASDAPDATGQPGTPRDGGPRSGPGPGPRGRDDRRGQPRQPSQSGDGPGPAGNEGGQPRRDGPRFDRGRGGNQPRRDGGPEGDDPNRPGSSPNPPNRPDNRPSNRPSNRPANPEGRNRGGAPAPPGPRDPSQPTQPPQSRPMQPRPDRDANPDAEPRDIEADDLMGPLDGDATDGPASDQGPGGEAGSGERRRRRRRRRRGPGGGQGPGGPGGPGGGGPEGSGGGPSSSPPPGGGGPSGPPQ